MVLHMLENRYRQFKDNRWYCTCGKRGSNQTVVLHMWQNVSPENVSNKYVITKLFIIFSEFVYLPEGPGPGTI